MTNQGVMHLTHKEQLLQLPCMKEAICDIQDVCRSLQERRAEAEKEVRKCFDALHELLDKRQTTLINSLNTIESEKQKTLGEQTMIINGVDQQNILLYPLLPDSRVYCVCSVCL